MYFRANNPSCRCTFSQVKLSLMTLALMQAFHPAHANPTGMAVAAGGALQSNPSTNTLQIVTLPGSILNWQNFSIARGETTRFVQENSASTVLNRVVGANPSNILGTLQSNGRVFLVNPNGIVFGGNSVVDTAGLIASTRDLSDANFTAGNYAFSGTGNGDITLTLPRRLAAASPSPLARSFWPQATRWTWAQTTLAK
ncbi:MAG: filamentous hemagglutinin outer membrane protein [Comamonadaceae bacterium]|nr:MAG: filamentous hemagglutinin outer membrane protein [Comamonadaceae bacterium]